MDLCEERRAFSPSAPPPSYESIAQILHQPQQNPHYGNVNHSPQYISPNRCGVNKSTNIWVTVLVIGLFIAGGLTTFYFSVAYGHLKQYGQPCLPSVPMSCGTTDLTCLISGICSCKSSDYKWDQEQELCLALVDSAAECRKWGWDGGLAIPCTGNAVCNAEHRCECLPYFAAVEHECIASYDGICSSSKECNQQEFLFCGKSGKCECRPGTVRHQKGNMFGCFVKIGETCAGIMRELCVDPNSECTKQEICRCNEEKGYVPSRESTSCGKTANGTCFTDSDCADTLSCRENETTNQAGLCYCHNTELLDETGQKCVIKGGERCDTRELKQCVENAVCKRSTCTCNRGYGLDQASGLCLGTHGTLCAASADCLVSQYFQCIDGKCGCDKNHTRFNMNTGSCFGNATGTACFSDLNCDQERMKCDPTTKTCTCASAFEEDNKFCYGTRGSSCLATDDCYRQQMLTCLGGTCQCNAAVEEWDDDACKLQLNQPCEESGNRLDMKCVGNLTCLSDPTHVFKMCGCDGKYIVSEDKRFCMNVAYSAYANMATILLTCALVKFL